MQLKTKSTKSRTANDFEFSSQQQKKSATPVRCYLPAHSRRVTTRMAMCPASEGCSGRA